jgi:hypothetical protein
MTDQNLITETVHDHTVRYTYNCLPGKQYLQEHLSHDESKAYFDEALNHGHADFKNQYGYHYRLTHESDASYTITKRTY